MSEKETTKETVEIVFDGKPYKVDKDLTINEASLKCLSEPIPHLCHHPYLPHSEFECGICKVKDNNTGEFIRSCKLKVEDGMDISTKSPKIAENIKEALKRKLSLHPLDCENCEVNGNCGFKDLLDKYGVTPETLNDEQKASYSKHYITYLQNKKATRYGNKSVVIDESKCIECYRCVRVCNHVQKMSCLKKNLNDLEDVVPFAKFDSLEDYHSKMFQSDCISCGQCSFVCPAGAITVNSDVVGVDELLKVKEKNGFILVAQTAPSVRVILSEEYGKKPGELKDTKLVAGLRKLGFDYVFDTNFTADLTILEEGNELIERIKNGGPFPMFTSCCPAWINMCEKHYPEFRENLSTCKSPQQMMGSLIKKYWSEKKKIPSGRIIVVSIMPCTAKKDECQRDQLKGDVDFVLTTRECGRLLKRNKINPFELEDSKYDDPLGESTGAAVIFGATGGVMEAALRTAYEVVVGKPLPSIDYKPARGLQGVKTAEVDLNGTIVRIAIGHSGKNIRKILKGIKEGKENYHFVEFMACPGGCIGGGGNSKFTLNKSMLQDRIDAIYKLDSGAKLRKSHENPSVKQIYEEFLKKPLGYYSKKLLHTFYTDRSVEKGKRAPKVEKVVTKTSQPITVTTPLGEPIKVPLDYQKFLDYENYRKYQEFKIFQTFLKKEPTAKVEKKL